MTIHDKQQKTIKIFLEDKGTTLSKIISHRQGHENFQMKMIRFDDN